MIGALIVGSSELGQARFLVDPELIDIALMTTQSKREEKSQRSIVWLLAGLAAVILRSLPNLRYPIGVDQGIYCIVGQGLLRGQLPYRDLWDVKPPGIYYIYALIVKAFGPVMWCVGVVDILWLLAISLCIFYFARRYLGAPAAALAMVFNAVRHCEIGYNNAAQAEPFLMLCVFAAWFLLLQPETTAAELSSERAASPPSGGGSVSILRALRCLAAGLALGAAVWLKYNAIVFFPFVLLMPFLNLHPPGGNSLSIRMAIAWKDWLVRMSFVALGFSIAVVAVLAHFWLSGAWPAMKEAHFMLLPRYGATGFHWGAFYLHRALRLTEANLGFWTEVIAPLSIVIAWKRRELPALAPVLLMAFAGYLCVAIQGRFHIYHFETCHQFFSMFWGYVAVKIWEGFQYVRKLFKERGWALAHGLTWVVLTALVYAVLAVERVRVMQHYEFLADWWSNPELSYKTYFPQLPLERLFDQLSIIEFLKQNSTHEDPVFVWGIAPVTNFLAERQNPSRFFYDYPLISTWGLKSWRLELVETLEKKRPRYIIVERYDANPVFTNNTMTSEEFLQRGQYPGLSNLMRREYEPAAHYNYFDVYRLKEHPEPALRNSTAE